MIRSRLSAPISAIKQRPVLPCVVAPPVRIDPRLAAALFGAAFLGMIAVLSLPAARAAGSAFGWMPLWLIGMPLASLAALYAGRNAQAHLPRRRRPDSSPDLRRRRPGTGVQASVPAPFRRASGKARHPLSRVA